MLQIAKTNKTLDSREVAEMIGKEHKNLIRDIRNYMEILGKLKIEPSSFFINSSYISNQSKELPCYLLTKQGCEMVANKMTGEKGVIFTAKYVQRFNQMEETLKPSSNLMGIQALENIVSVLKQQELEQQRIVQAMEEQQAQLNTIKDGINIVPYNWRNTTNKILNKIGSQIGDYSLPKEEAYKALELRGKCSLSRRLSNLKERMAVYGATQTKLNTLNYLDVIEGDEVLIELYTKIVREMNDKYIA